MVVEVVEGAECWKHLMCISTNGTVPLFPNLNIVNNNNCYILRRGEENARRGGGIASRGSRGKGLKVKVQGLGFRV